MLKTQDTSQAKRRSEIERRRSDRRLADAAAFDAWLALGKADRRRGPDRRTGLDRRQSLFSNR